MTRAQLLTMGILGKDSLKYLADINELDVTDGSSSEGFSEDSIGDSFDGNHGKSSTPNKGNNSLVGNTQSKRRVKRFIRGN